MRLTLRTLLAYLDDTLDADQSRQIGHKLAENPEAQALVERIRRVSRSRSIATPASGPDGGMTDPNTVAAYLSDALTSEQIAKFEAACLDSDAHLAEIATCHQILTLVLCEQIRIPPTARKRMYQLVKTRESIPDRPPGNLIPVGGVVEDAKTGEDDTDMSYSLGLTSSGKGSGGAIVSRVLVPLALLVGVIVAFWISWPKSEPITEAGPMFAFVSAPNSTTTPIDGGTKAPPITVPTKPDTKPDPSVPSTTPKTPETVTPEPTIPAPSAERVAVGQAEKTTAGILVRRAPGQPLWERVLASNADLLGGDRLVALPGYKADVKLAGGIDAHLWGNLPDLLFAPFLDTAIVPAAPPASVDADLTILTGRVYLATKQPGGKTVRLRIRSEVWDVKLADEKTEIVLEVTHFLMPDTAGDSIVTSIALAVLSGEASCQTKPLSTTAPIVLPRGGQIHWESRGKKIEAIPKPDPQEWAALAGYLAKIQVYPDAKRSEVTLTALKEFSTKLTDPTRVRAVFDEALQSEMGPQNAAQEAGIRVALFAFAALGDVTGLATAMMDTRHPVYRVTANEAIRYALAEDPTLMEPFRKILTETIRLGDDRVTEIVRLLKGLSNTERSEGFAVTLDRLITNLSSDSVPIREMSFRHLTTFLDPQDPANQSLPYFDAAAPVDARDAAIKAWKKKVEELKAKPAPTPLPSSESEPIPPPRMK